MQVGVPGVVEVSKVSRPGQDSTAFGGAEHVDIPVPQGRGRAGQAGIQGFSQVQGSTACSGADLVVIPVPRRGGLHGPASAASSSLWFFALSPNQKKCWVGSALGFGIGCGL